MTDWDDHPIAAIADAEPATFPAPALPPPIPEPLWRARPPLQTSAIALSLRSLAHSRIKLRTDPLPNMSAPVDPGTPFGVQHFTLLVLGHDEAAAFDYVESLIARGTATELIFLNLLAPTAQRLGEMWEDDTANFLNVTLGVSRLQRILRHLGESVADDHRVSGSGTVLLTTISGEQHSFGLTMVAEFFRRDGWDIWTGPFDSHLELISLVQDRAFDVVGFSIGGDRHLDQLKRDIENIRRESRNRHVAILLGGPLLVHQPELVSATGADGYAIDGSTAPRLARVLVHAARNRG
ncbi:cobalamin-binding protein [Rhodopseudomonas palustris]|uniref:Cobalamin-binding protein n=2 Tax=Rhodopseudomonas palustris TaxID=1076 RepID=A0A323ULS2_RHOPL|nr:cobalamin-binding protein [Rhodopseudomonas palustris]